VPCDLPYRLQQGPNTTGGATSAFNDPLLTVDALSRLVLGGGPCLPEGKYTAFAVGIGSGPEGSSLTMDC